MDALPLVETIRTPVHQSADVIVCGGGPAGFAAAVSAARAGARTMLIELQGCLGGVWTVGALSWIIDYENKGGLMGEIVEALEVAGGRARGKNGEYTSGYDVETMKFVLESMALEAGVHVRMHTRVVAAVVNEERRLTHIVTESKSGREAWAAKLFVDATGDGDLAALAGCRYGIGRPENGRMQPMSLMALLTGIRFDDVADYCVEGANEAGKARLLERLVRQGCVPSYSAPTLFHISGTVFALMANHQYGCSSLSADDLTRATLAARREVWDVVSALRRSGPEWCGVQLVATGAQIGVREGRRIRGLYTVTQKDLEEGRQHSDSICTVSFCVDIHSTDPEKGKAYGNGGVIVKPYQIPLRAAIAADVDGLMMAGRCISGDFIAHASYRVTGNAVQMGESVGKVAAIAVSQGTLPQNLLQAGTSGGV